ncbi:hypothetical protein BT96DRAFT_990148 [Gymnopus androsaceus JB14]|uniref:Uncharacterized protein n=1 Tax=Gymnopus androsaceus JB14 TaxID=1447944 RepID=A0A6A4HZK6_9AGAR|nr:hypothetical protein BT96DRAFT_990148 [Gymnopus androsaceus JB14]
MSLFLFFRAFNITTSSDDDPVAVRNQISMLKHNIRHQQVQVSKLEILTHIWSSLSSMASTSNSSLSLSLGSLPLPPSSYTSAHSPTPTSKATRRTSYKVLQGIAGPDPGLPLPVNGHGRMNGGGNSLDKINVNGIREGVPMMMSPTAYK